MTGGRRILVSMSALLGVLACGGGEKDTAATAGQADTAPAPARNTTNAAAADTGAAAPAAPARDTSAQVAQKPEVKPAPTPKPAPRPAAPKKPAPAPAPAPAPSPALGTGAGAPAETPAAAPAPAESTPVAAPPAEAGGGLRDAYHQAPRDTVTAEVYDGWKQFNLNCARCHGEDVLGTTIAPHLIVSVRPGGAADTKEAFVQTVCVGRPEKGMPAWCPLGLEMEKINAIYAYVKGRSEGKIAPGRPARRQ
jgi:hypothetical protein